MQLGDRRLGRRRPAGEPRRWSGRADRRGGRRRRACGAESLEAAVVGAVGKHHHIGGEPVAADVAALPGLARPPVGRAPRPPGDHGRRSRCRARRGRRPAAPAQRTCWSGVTGDSARCGERSPPPTGPTPAASCPRLRPTPTRIDRPAAGAGVASAPTGATDQAAAGRGSRRTARGQRGDDARATTRRRPARRTARVRGARSAGTLRSRGAVPTSGSPRLPSRVGTAERRRAHPVTARPVSSKRPGEPETELARGGRAAHATRSVKASRSAAAMVTSPARLATVRPPSVRSTSDAAR